MEINVRKILNRETSIIPFDMDYNVGIDKLFEDVGMIEPSQLHATGKIERINSILFLEMTISGEFTFNCYRCFKKTSINFNSELKKTLTTNDSENLSEIVLVDDIINIKDVIKEEIIIKLPSQILCTEDCKGICQICGINLNEESCDCKKESINSGFEVLKDFFSDDE